MTSGRRWLGVLLLLATLVSFPLHAANASSGKRFLFIIDTSAAMKPLEMPMRETLFDLIYSGARGKMTDGDTYGIWLVNDKVNTSFPMETWKQKFAVEIAAKAVSHMKDNGYRGSANLALAMADAQKVVRNIEDLNIILISNGETPVSGTPFDQAINAAVQELAPKMKLAKATVNTVLVAQEGTFVAWANNSPEFLIEFPSVPPRKKQPVPLAKTPAAPTPAPVAAPKLRVASNPIIITKDSVEQERRSYMPSTTAIAAAATNNLTQQTNVVVTTSNAAPVESTAPINTVTVVNAATNSAAVVTSKLPEPTPTNRTLQATQAVNVVASQTPASPSSVERGDSSTNTPAAATTPRMFFAIVCASAGAVGAILAVVCVFVIIRSRKREPSLISQAIVRDRMSQARQV